MKDTVNILNIVSFVVGPLQAGPVALKPSKLRGPHLLVCSLRYLQLL